MMNLFEALRDDHAVQRELLEKIAETHGDSAQRRALFADLSAALSNHALAEERSLYAPMLERRMSTEIARHSVAEHKEIDDIVDELKDMALDNPNWIRRHEVLCERVRHHLDEEEHGVFQIAGKVLNDHEKTALGRNYVGEMKRLAAQ